MSGRETIIEANGLRFACLEAGRTEHPLVVCLHGFPDDARTFDGLIPGLVESGYRVVAPFTRGYAPTSIPANGDYSVQALASDVLAILDRLDRKSAFLIGHDWGAITGYVAANLAPERINGLIALAIPHPGALRFSVGQLSASDQFLLLPWGGLSEWFARRDDFAYVARLVRRWSPTWSTAGRDEQIARMRAKFGEPGRLAAAIGYYRSFRRDLLQPRRVALYRAPTSVPTLTIYGQEDGATQVSAFARTATSFTGPYHLQGIPGVGHFVHRESPDLVARLIGNFLADPAGFQATPSTKEIL